MEMKLCFCSGWKVKGSCTRFTKTLLMYVLIKDKTRGKEESEIFIKYVGYRVYSIFYLQRV